MYRRRSRQGISPTGTAGEIQLVFTGSGESVEYPTKAIASEKENNIDELDIYVFAAATMTTDPDDWHYLETWSTRAGAANSFTLQNSGSSWKASIKPGELKGLPYLKLYWCRQFTKWQQI